MSNAKTQPSSPTRDQQPSRGDNRANRQGQQQQGQQGQQQGITLAEWVTTGIAAAILLGVAGFVLYLWIVSPNEEPIIRVSQAGEIRSVGEQFYVPFQVENLGDRAVTAVATKAELTVDGQVVEQGQVHFNWLSGGERELGVFVFSNDPSSGELKLSVGSYRIP